LNGNAPKFVTLVLGQISLDGQVQVLSGLQASDRVVVYSEKEINAKTRIKIVSSLVAQQP
jgi:HlyD family secretion protein